MANEWTMNGMLRDENELMKISLGMIWVVVVMLLKDSISLQTLTYYVSVYT